MQGGYQNTTPEKVGHSWCGSGKPGDKADATALARTREFEEAQQVVAAGEKARVRRGNLKYIPNGVAVNRSIKRMPICGGIMS